MESIFRDFHDFQGIERDGEMGKDGTIEKKERRGRALLSRDVFVRRRSKEFESFETVSERRR